jgi:hypothetical protein
MISMILFSVVGFARLIIILLIVYFAYKFITRLWALNNERVKQNQANNDPKIDRGGEYIDYEEVK